VRDEWEADRHAHLSMGEAETRLPGPELYLRHDGTVFKKSADALNPEVEFTAKIKLDHFSFVNPSLAPGFLSIGSEFFKSSYWKIYRFRYV
jgi:hypothetical protein